MKGYDLVTFILSENIQMFDVKVHIDSEDIKKNGECPTFGDNYEIKKVGIDRNEKTIILDIKEK